MSTERALLAVAALALLLRLPGLSDPPLNTHHVRQCDTAAIARTFARDGIDLLRPRVPWGGRDGAVVESELPLYAAAVSLGFPQRGTGGPATWVWARSVGLVAWALGAWALVRVLRRWNRPTALGLAPWAFSPLALIANPNVQPDTSAVAALLWALERASTGHKRAWMATGLLVGLAVVMKGNVGFFAGGVLWVAAHTYGPGRALAAAVFAAAIVVPWYLHAANLGVEGVSFGLWGASAAKWTPGLPDAKGLRTVLGIALGRTLGPVGVVAALVLLPALRGALRNQGTAERAPPAAEPAPGLGSPAFSPAERGLLVGTLGGFLALTLTALPAVRVHDYYQLGAAALLAPALGRGLETIIREFRRPVAKGWRVPRMATAVGVVVAAVLWTGNELRIGKTLERRVLRAADVVRTQVPEGAPVVLFDPRPTSTLFFADRRGWAAADPAAIRSAGPPPDPDALVVDTRGLP